MGSGVGPDRVLVPAAAGGHGVIGGVALVRAVGVMTGRLEQVEPDVLAWEVVHRQVPRLEQVDRPAAVRDRLPADVRDRIEVATYDQTIRFNITLVNNELCIAQPYLPHSRGVEAPTMVIKKRWPSAGLFPVFDRTFTELWNGGHPR